MKKDKPIFKVLQKGEREEGNQTIQMLVIRKGGNQQIVILQQKVTR